MTDAHDIARHAAQRLATQYGNELPMAVEKAILSAEQGGKPEQFVTPGDWGNIATAIIAFAALAWTIWRDTSAGDKKPDAETLRRELRLQIPAPTGLDAATRDEIIVTITEEVMKK